ncbi:hypothetical protein NKI32_08505 [Mesorhizobium sp. M0761]|uniref:hypothetical protein n=1 Tax=unclassified Mesorhizobium TaxID=325217 RepID=UPI00333905A3
MSQTHTLQPSSIRFPVQPRLVPAIKAAYFADLPPADITLELLDDGMAVCCGSKVSTSPTVP